MNNTLLFISACLAKNQKSKIKIIYGDQKFVAAHLILLL